MLFQRGNDATSVCETIDLFWLSMSRATKPANFIYGNNNKRSMPSFESLLVSIL